MAPKLRACRWALALGAASGALVPAAAQQRGGSRSLTPQLQPPGIGGQAGAGLVGGTGGNSTTLDGYIEVRERVSIFAGQSGGGGASVRASTLFNVGGSAGIERERIQAGASGNLQYSLGTGGGGRSRLTANGIARIVAEPIRDTLVLTGSAYGGLVSGQFGQAQLADPIDQEPTDLNQFYSLAGSANFSRDIANRIRATASYQYSYVDVGNRIGGRGGGGGSGGFGGNGFGGLISNSKSQFASASLGLVPGTSRLTVTASGSYVHNEQDLLEQRFESKSGTLDLSYAVNRNLSLLGSAGYQDYESTRQAIRFGPDFLAANPEALAAFQAGDPTRLGDIVPTTPDPNNPETFIANIPGLPPFTIGLPNGYSLPNQGDFGVIFLGPQFLRNDISRTQNPNDPFIATIGGAGAQQLVQTGFGPLTDPRTGGFIPDPAAPRDTLYAQRGLVWNAGFRYVPSSRLSTELRVGQRFSSVTVTGTVNYRLNRRSTLIAQLTDGIETFGTITTRIINGVPVSIAQGRGGGGGAGFLGGCVFGPDPRQPFGCVDGEIQSVSSGVFRSRIASVVFSTGRPSSRLSVRALYNQRDYLDRGQSVGPGGVPIDPTLANRTDRSAELISAYTRALGREDSLTTSFGGGYFDQSLSGRSSSYFLRANVRYSRGITERLLAVATLAATQRFASGDPAAQSNSFFGFNQRDRTNFAVTGGVRYEF